MAQGWDWGDPPTFGGVCSGKCEIFLCVGAQGGRDSRPLQPVSGFSEAEARTHGVWMSIWVENADAVYGRCRDQGVEVTMPPHDMPWGVRELHVRHPDGHMFRISPGLSGE